MALITTLSLGRLEMTLGHWEISADRSSTGWEIDLYDSGLTKGEAFTITCDAL